MRTRWLAVLAVAGIIVSAYLTIQSHDPASVICSIGGACEVVLSSKYAFIFGVPVSAFGLAWYLALLAIIWALSAGVGSLSRLKITVKAWAILGLIFSLYLLSVEMFILHAYCTWCLVSLGLVLLINALVFIKTKEHDKRQ